MWFSLLAGVLILIVYKSTNCCCEPKFKISFFTLPSLSRKFNFFPSVFFVDAQKRFIIYSVKIYCIFYDFVFWLIDLCVNNAQFRFSFGNKNNFLKMISMIFRELKEEEKNRRDFLIKCVWRLFLSARTERSHWRFKRRKSEISNVFLPNNGSFFSEITLKATIKTLFVVITKKAYDPNKKTRYLTDRVFLWFNSVFQL